MRREMRVLALLVAVMAAVLACSVSVASAASVSPAELSFSMAELDSASAAIPTLSVDPAPLNENEADASEEGISDDEVFAEVEAQAANCTASAAPGTPQPPPPVNPTVAIIKGKPVSKAEFVAAGHPIAMPQLKDPQPVNGVKVPGKLTPGFHCEHRVGCRSCLRLSSCLWNVKTKKCAAITAVGAMSRRDQWDHVATCDRSLPPSQQRIDRRDRQAVRPAAEHRRLDKRVFTPIAAVEVDSGADGDAEVDADVDSDADVDVDSDADVDTDDETEPAEFETEGTVPIANKHRFAAAEAEADAEATATTEQPLNAAFSQLLKLRTKINAQQQ